MSGRFKDRLTCIEELYDRLRIAGKGGGGWRMEEVARSVSPARKCLRVEVDKLSRRSRRRDQYCS
eukprot:747123-Hanusia_phi.AAC.2